MTENTEQTDPRCQGDSADARWTPMVIAKTAEVPRHRVLIMAKKLGISPVLVQAGVRKDRRFSDEQAADLVAALREDDRLIRSRRILTETCRVAVGAYRRRAEAAALQAPGGVCSR